MKTKTLLLILAFGLIINAFGQKPTMELTFTAENNGQYVPLDSIFIENLTQGGDTTLYAPDTVLVLDYITSIENNGIINGNTLYVSQNYPNPFEEKTEVNVYLPENEHIKIIVWDILGRELAKYENTLNSGNHSFAFYAGDEKYYLLTVIGKQSSKTIKMLSTNNMSAHGRNCSLLHNESNNNIVGLKSQTARDNFTFSIGDELSYTAYTDVELLTIIGSPTTGGTITFQFDNWTPCPGMSTVTDIDGNIYNTVQIGNQCWMKENLRTITYSNNTPIPNVIDESSWQNLTTGAYVWHYNEKNWKDIYGALYNWYAIINTNGLCPTGWHVPTNGEWTTLTDFIGGTASPHGNELKSCRQVNSPLGGGCNTTQHPRWNQDNIDWGTDNYGFSGVPGGIRDFNGTFFDFGESSFWWSSTESSTSYAWDRYLIYLYGFVLVNDSFSKRNGMSVRCIRD